jgi:DNA invertase Pin-like site-specific DNA recombinase
MHVPAPSADLPQPKDKASRAAEYVRMSTEHQQYSTENQRNVIRQYAERRGMVIVRTYTDAGKSGLRIGNRQALKQLIRDVETNQADFGVILVYDVSRWGRFQDADESAYYEYTCRRAKIEVHYCAEQFENDGSPISAIVKGVKRAMAGEYSRELSAKTFIGQCRLIESGFRQGGASGYGLRRMLCDAMGRPKGILNRGEKKSIQTDRVVLVPGPTEEIEVVRWIYHTFVEQKTSKPKLARMLNQRGILTELGRPWTPNKVHQVLTNEKYIGNNLFNRVSFKLRKKHIANAPDKWIRNNGAFEAVVPIDLFQRARAIIREYRHGFTDDELLQQLRGLLDRKGHLSGVLIDETEGMARSRAYFRHFGSLRRAYALIGHSPKRDYWFIETRRQLRLARSKIVAELIENMRRKGGIVQIDSETELLTVNGEFTVSIVMACCRQRESGEFRWRIRLDAGLKADITVVVRMAVGNVHPLDYYVIPRLDVLDRVADYSLGTLRFKTPDCFLEMAQRVRLPEAGN